MVYGTQITIITGAYKPTNIAGGPHIVGMQMALYTGYLIQQRCERCECSSEQGWKGNSIKTIRVVTKNRIPSSWIMIICISQKMDGIVPELFMNLGFAACSHAFSNHWLESSWIYNKFFSAGPTYHVVASVPLYPHLTCLFLYPSIFLYHIPYPTSISCG